MDIILLVGVDLYPPVSHPQAAFRIHTFPY
jgi:hypothetical protein